MLFYNGRAWSCASPRIYIADYLSRRQNKVIKRNFQELFAIKKLLNRQTDVKAINILLSVLTIDNFEKNWKNLLHLRIYTSEK